MSAIKEARFSGFIPALSFLINDVFLLSEASSALRVERSLWKARKSWSPETGLSRFRGKFAYQVCL